MKKVALGLFALTILGAASCKKKDEGSSTTPTPTPTPTVKNYYKVDTTTFDIVNAGRYKDGTTGVLDMILAGNFPKNSCNLYFLKFPTENGTYKIIEDEGSYPKSDELIIIVLKEFSGYHSMNKGTASVTVNNGKITVNIAGTKLYDNTDTVDFSCNIIQTN